MADVLDVDKARKALMVIEGLSIEPGRTPGAVEVNSADWLAALTLAHEALGGEKCTRCRERFPAPKLSIGYCDSCCEAACAGCGHALGIHQVGEDGLEDCADCDCGAFEDPLEVTRAALAEREGK